MLLNANSSCPLLPFEMHGVYNAPKKWSAFEVEWLFVSEDKDNIKREK